MNLKSSHIPTWCPGCSDFFLYAGVDQALNQLNIPQENIVIVYDIGCMGNMADFMNTYAIHSLHGRCVPTAAGVKLQNPNLTVIAIGGDGGIYGEGFNHLIAAARNNFDIKVLVANNHLYSLTTGQASPTTPKGSKTKSTPVGTIGVPLDAVQIVKTVNPSVFAQTIDGKQIPLIIDTIKTAITTPGFALIDLQQVCVTFGKQLNS